MQSYYMKEKITVTIAEKMLKAIKQQTAKYKKWETKLKQNFDEKNPFRQSHYLAYHKYNYNNLNLSYDEYCSKLKELENNTTKEFLQHETNVEYHYWYYFQFVEPENAKLAERIYQKFMLFQHKDNKDNKNKNQNKEKFIYTCLNDRLYLQQCCMTKKFVLMNTDFFNLFYLPLFNFTGCYYNGVSKSGGSKAEKLLWECLLCLGREKIRKGKPIRHSQGHLMHPDLVCEYKDLKTGKQIEQTFECKAKSFGNLGSDGKIPTHTQTQYRPIPNLYIVLQGLNEFRYKYSYIYLFNKTLNMNEKLNFTFPSYVFQPYEILKLNGISPNDNNINKYTSIELEELAEKLILNNYIDAFRQYKNNQKDQTAFIGMSDLLSLIEPTLSL